MKTRLGAGAALGMASLVLASVIGIVRAQADTGHAFMGVHVMVGSDACSNVDKATALGDFESCVGRKAALDRQYYAWDTPFTGYEAWTRDQGRALFVNWVAKTRAGSVVQWASIANGQQDAAIDARAAEIKSLGVTVYVAFDEDPELDAGNANGSAADFVAAWKHIHDRFVASGATDVRWVWVLSAWTFNPASGRDPDTFYPGSTYVDYVGSGGLNYYTCGGRSSPWKAFGGIFGAFDAWAVAHGEPAVVVDWGTVEDPSQAGRKASWVSDASTWLKSHPNIVGLSATHSAGQGCDWWVDSSTSSLQAYRALIADPYFQASAGDGSDPTPTPSDSGTPAPPEGISVFFGAHVAQGKDGCSSDGTMDQAVAALESCIGRKLATDREYNNWDDSFPTTWHDEHSRDLGRTLMWSWDATTNSGTHIPWRDIASGTYDSLINQRADAIKAFGAKVLFIFQHEPEDNVGKNGTPADFVAAWKHMHDRFQARGATNVKWVLTLMAWTFNTQSGRNPNDYYPGASYVDYIGADGYNWYGCLDRPLRWVSFGERFQSLYAYSIAKGKPAVAVEFGSVEDPADPNRKGQWFKDALTWVKAHPNMTGVSYFHSPTECDWWVDSTPASLAGYKAMANDPYMNGKP